MPRKRIKLDRDAAGNLKEGGDVYEEEIDEDGDLIQEDEIDEDEDEDRIVTHGVVVHFREKSIKRTFGAGQTVISGGSLTRTFTPETHGKRYQDKANEFIESMKLEDGNERPKYISHTEY